MHRNIRFCIISILLLTVVSTSTGNATADGNIEAITNPSADVTLSFVQPGRIMAVLLSEGDTVKAGQVLVRQNDAAEQARLAQIKAQSENESQLEASKASLDQKIVDLEKLEWAAERGAATPREVAHAKLDVRIAELSRDIAEFDLQQSKRKYLEEKIRVDNMTLKSPIDGRVEKIDVEVGESTNVLADVIRVVRIDPLWIDVYVPLNRARTIKAGAAATIRFPDGDNPTVAGKVIFVAAVADAASSTLRTRIEVPNKTNRPAGEHVTVILQDAK